MKNIVILAVFILSVFSAEAQFRRPVVLNDPGYDTGKPLKFGFSLGLNLMDFHLRSRNSSVQDADYFVEPTHLVPGFTVNAIADLRLTENVHLRFMPGYVFGQRNLDFFRMDNSGKVTLDRTMEIESNFIDLPIGFKYLSERVSNIRPYLYFGVNPRVDLAAFKRIKTEKGIYLKLQQFNVYYEIGFGIDFFLNYFKFSTELKWSAGFGSAISGEYAEEGKQYRDAIDRMRSNMFIIAFHFE